MPTARCGICKNGPFVWHKRSGPVRPIRTAPDQGASPDADPESATLSTTIQSLVGGKNRTVIAIVFLILGGFFCCMNFYLSFLRYPLHRMRCGKKDNYTWMSRVPLIGSFLLALSLLMHHAFSWLFVMAISLIAIDTGGIRWSLGTSLYHTGRKKNR